MFFISGVLVAIAGLFYLAGRGHIQMLSGLCTMTDPIFCSNPQWILYAAGAFLLGGLLSKIG